MTFESIDSIAGRQSKLLIMHLGKTTFANVVFESPNTSEQQHFGIRCSFCTSRLRGIPCSYRSFIVVVSVSDIKICIINQNSKRIVSVLL